MCVQVAHLSKYIRGFEINRRQMRAWTSDLLLCSGCLSLHPDDTSWMLVTSKILSVCSPRFPPKLSALFSPPGANLTDSYQCAPCSLAFC